MMPYQLLKLSGVEQSYDGAERIAKEVTSVRFNESVRMGGARRINEHLTRTNSVLN
jgi:hypothetical protein